MLNFIKGIACIGVVFIHVGFPGKFGLIIAKLCQFAVPIFAMTAGFYALNSTEETVQRRLFKIVRIFVFALIWFIAYAVLSHWLDGNLMEWIKDELSVVNFVKFIVFTKLDFAIPLWYLIGMIETYIVWWFVVKHKREDIFLKFMPIMFLLQFALTTFCETKGMPWSLKMNFVTRVFSWFLLGYYLHKNQDIVLNMVRKMHLIIAALIGILISLSHLVFRIRIDFSCVGVFILSMSLFIIAMKYKDVSISSGVEYLGNYLSLNVYIFHSIIAGIFIIIANRLLGIDTATGWFPWVNPLLTVFVSIMVAYIINSFKKGNV